MHRQMPITVAFLPGATSTPILDAGQAAHYLLIMFETFGWDFHPMSRACDNITGPDWDRPLFSPKACTVIDQRNRELRDLESWGEWDLMTAWDKVTS